MPLFLSDQIENFLPIGGTANAGLLGGQNLPRATEIRGVLKVYHFTFEQDALNPMPGVDPTALASNDAVIVALLKPTDWIYAGFFTANAWGGTNVLMAFGRIDPNNSANNDPTHYSQPVALAAGVGWYTLDGFFNSNLATQAGDDPRGDQSVGNTIPEFGSQDIQIVATFAADAFGTGGTVEGYIYVVEEGN